MQWVFEHSRATGSARVLMLAIADRANDDGVCWPDKANLAKKVNVTERTIIKLVQQCEELGELSVSLFYRGKERRTANRYIMMALAPAEVRATATPVVTVPLPPKMAKDRKRRGLKGEHVITPVNRDAHITPPVNTSSPGGVNTSSPDSSVSSTVEPTTPPASAESVSDAGKSRYKSFAEQHPDLFDAELEDTKRAAVADLVADGAKRYINNTLKDQLERTVAHIFQTGGGEARVIARMLRGKSSSKDGEAWREAGADFRGDPVEAEELTDWAAWYQRKYPDQSLTKSPHKLAGSILYWRENAKRESSRTGSEYYGGYKIVG